jgi:hypothetical protein
MSTNTWHEFLKTSIGKKRIAITSAILLVMFLAVLMTLSYVETRKGYVIESSFGELYGHPIDFSLPIFALTYLTICYALVSTARKPDSLLRLLTAYCIMQFMRCACLILVPLDPSPEILPLNDPVLQLTFYNGRENLKDLFFSGHVATVVIVAFLSESSRTRMLFFIGAALVGFFLIQQRVHYTIDVVAAPVFAWFAVRLGDAASRSMSSTSSSSNTDQSNSIGE